MCSNDSLKAWSDNYIVIAVVLVTLKEYYNQSSLHSNSMYTCNTKTVA